MKNPASTCQGPMSRRGFLKMGALTLGGIGALDLIPWQVRGEERRDTPDTSVILIWLPGGPAHVDTYDMKPNAPDEVRGEFRPIRTNVPGIDVCEHLPMHARCADKYSIIRSVHHRFADHGGGHKKFLTGRDPFQPVGFVNDHPMVGSMVARVRPARVTGMPNYIAGVDGGRSQVDTFSFGSAYLGASVHPFTVVGDPADPRFQVGNLEMLPQVAANVQDRLTLLERFDRVPDAIDPTRNMETMAIHRQRAMTILNANNARAAFDLSREPQYVRNRYGMHRYGQRALLARRLVEAGATFVTMVMENPSFPGESFPSDATYNWDSHAVNCHIFNDSKFRFPMYDRAVTALIEDLYERGLDKKVLLIVTGEFGRTPRLEYTKNRPGRDHWPQAMSILVSGGGLKTGQIIGSTDSMGGHPKDRPLVPSDLWATMFRHLSIDPFNTSFLDHTGRPMPILAEGAPIAELI
jgi:hypothetical protein